MGYCTIVGQVADSWSEHQKAVRRQMLEFWNGAHVQAAALRQAFPGYAVNVIPRMGERPRYELVSRDGGNPYCLISDDPGEIWRSLQNG